MHKTSVYISAKRQKNQLQKGFMPQFKLFPDCENNVLNIYSDLKYQKIDGFGGAFTESSAINFSKMSDKKKSELTEMLFGKNGLKYNYCRTTINSCDFSSDEYTYVAQDDTTLNTFDISHEKTDIIPFINAAKAVTHDLYLFASPWSPCGWMKNTGKMENGGKLKPEMKSVWAMYFVKYIKECLKCGIKISAVTVQNEPMASQVWESCEFTSREQIEFVRDYLYPEFQKSGLKKVKIFIWDHNKEHIYDWANQLKSIDGAAKTVDGIAFHWYSGEHFDSLKFAHEIMPDKKLVLSEFCLGGTNSKWENCEKYAYEIIGDFNNFANAICDWNLVLDTNGGPYHHRKGGCQTAVHYDIEKDDLIKMPQYYAIAHFSKFIKRGAVRLGTTSFSNKLSFCAFENPDGEIVAVILNSGKAQEAWVKLDNFAASLMLKPHSITTVVIDRNGS